MALRADKLPTGGYIASLVLVRPANTYMSDPMAETPEQRDPRRRKIMYRCWHRGMKEMDILLGKFVEARIDGLSDTELDELERILTENDQDLYAWMTGRKEAPERLGGPLYRQIISFHAERSGLAN